MPGTGDFWSSLGAFLTRADGESVEPTREELTELLWRYQLRADRRAIRNGPYSGDAGSSKRRSADKFSRNVTRRRLAKFKRDAKIKRPRTLSKRHLLVRFQRSPILDALLSTRATRWRPILKRAMKSQSTVVELKDFTFLENPVGTLAAFRRIAEVEGVELSARLNFEDNFCLDAGAYLVLAEIWHSVRHSLSGGKMPIPIQKVLSATGVGEHNQMRLQGVDPNDDDDPEKTQVWAFRLRRRRPAGTSRSSTVHLDPQTREKVADDFCDEIDRWIGVREIDQELTAAGKAWLGSIIGELLCNAERHSQSGSEDGDWSMTAFMVKRSESEGVTFRCHIAFLSVGRSIADGLQDAAPEMRKAIDRYTGRHKDCGLSTATLETVFALQDTVTRDPAAYEHRSGGTGFQDVLDFVTELAGTAAPGKEPKVTVVSGKSCIQMRRPYIVGVRKSEGDKRLIYFNAENDPGVPPDPAFVQDLPERFAGTLVSVAFTLDPTYLAANSESDDANNQS